MLRLDFVVDNVPFLHLRCAHLLIAATLLSVRSVRGATRDTRTPMDPHSPLKRPLCAAAIHIPLCCPPVFTYGPRPAVTAATGTPDLVQCIRSLPDLGSGGRRCLWSGVPGHPQTHQPKGSDQKDRAVRTVDVMSPDAPRAQAPQTLFP